MTDKSGKADSPLFGAKQYGEPSVFRPAALLREARRQKELPDHSVPEVCVLDPDGDLVQHLVSTGRAERDESWPGYHTDLYRFDLSGTEIGIVGHAVGAPFAVLVAEQLFVAGCQFLVSITSSGQIVPKENPPYFVLIERALRDEGTSHHYRSPAEYATLDATLRDPSLRRVRLLLDRCTRARRGRQTRRFERQRLPSSAPARRGFSQSRWKQRRCTRSPPSETMLSSVSPT